MTAIFISGATSGIGLATARHFSSLGWRVFAGGLPSDDFSPLLDDMSTPVMPLKLDITSEQSVRTAVEQVRQVTQGDGLQALVNCAGINVPSPLELLDIDELKRQFEVNVYGHLRVIQALLPELRPVKGRIVNVSSLMGQVAMPMLGAYSMSKHALEAMSDVLRLELTPWGIRVSVIEMGAVQTPMTHSMSQLVQNAYDRHPQQAQQFYAGLFAGMQKALVQQEQNAIPVANVVQAIYQAVTAKKPKTRYRVDGATQGLIIMRTFAPDEVGDAILKRALGLK